ncbi:hypothetical protein GCM10010520_66970 [Rhizobium viscosum]|uniref:KTSC domain-containing protein n=1 Tax=Rhizobium viscosum TaxID=1673 RepID=A0ABR9ITV3_RHIVS|nr:KTSC domain-containing protein [Rhizobium viscosum]MBE1506629.1 hypothetical protein [Rhizobium viscosum]
MTWTSFECHKVRKVKYNERDRTLEILYADGGSAHASGITKSRYAQLMSTRPEDRDIFFQNIIEPYVVTRRKPPPSPVTILKFIAAALLLGVFLWFLF